MKFQHQLRSDWELIAGGGGRVRSLYGCGPSAAHDPEDESIPMHVQAGIGGFSGLNIKST